MTYQSTPAAFVLALVMMASLWVPTLAAPAAPPAPAAALVPALA